MKALQALKQIFGYDTFKQGQEELVGGILQGRDVLGVMPTGAGKSVCYQLPAALMDGVTLVISPLISLMKDQVDALNQLGLPTTSINSTLSAGELNERFRAIAEGTYKLVYIAPERLESERFLRLIGQLRIPLVAVDEAHCVSQWGHDFRPSYMNIPTLIGRIEPRPVTAAFTATATDQVKQDIVKHLGMRNPHRVTTGYERDNLTFSVVKGVDKRDYLTTFIRQRRQDAGIVYASTRKEVEDLYRHLVKLGIRAGRYHAGLSDGERARMQEDFLYDEIKVMAATNAFGMGIDKSNVRYVVHYNMPRNIESYYQEAGRAGRDGQPGECVLLYAPQDVMTQKFLIRQSEASEERRAAEYGNLNGMVEYAHTSDCLQRYVVSYFGDPNARDCGRCGNCTDDRGATDITRAAQKIFSCVARMKQRYGVTMTAKVLRGANDAKVRRFGFDRLPTYGAMRDEKEKTIVGMIQTLVADGYLRLTDSEYPTLALAPRAIDVLEGRESVFQKKAAEPAAASRSALADEAQESLFEQLRRLRKSFAERQRVPPFTIFHDATLVEMARAMPQSLEELLAIKGVGQSKCDRYGQAFLDCIRGFRPEEV